MRDHGCHAAGPGQSVLGAAVAVVALLAVPLAAAAQGESPLLLRQPALSATQICFSFAGDIWVVPRAGGAARRVTASPEQQSGCRFSPDGRRIAYTGERDGNSDVFVVDAAGGEPTRLTYHPAADFAVGWTPDGRVLLGSVREGMVFGGFPARLYTQAIGGVAPEPIELPSGFDGALSPDGRRLAYMPITPANRAWKRYRGGRTTPIWIVDLADASIEKVPRDNSTDTAPMWVADTIFFLSDRDGPVTLYGYDLTTRRVARRIDNGGLDIKNAAAGPGGIVYEQFGAIHLYDVASGKHSEVPVRLSGELTQALPRWLNVSDMLQHAALSPTGARAAFEARGEIITVPAKKGDVRNVTRTTGVTERFPVWSPDGQTLAWFSSAGGSYHLQLMPQSGTGAARSIALGDADTYYYAPEWSPDGKLIAYSNSRGEIGLVDVASGKASRVDTEPIGGLYFEDGIPLAWSPDSRWLTYARSIRNRLTAVFVYDVQGRAATQVTDGMSDARNPVFDASGKYLYFVSSTDIGPAQDVISMATYDRPVSRSLYAIVLRRDLRSPVAPESDEETGGADSATARPSARPATQPGATRARAQAEPVRIDFEAIDQRTVPLPVPPRNYVSIAAGKAGVVVLAEAPLVPITLRDGAPPRLVLHRFDLSERKVEQLIDGVVAFDVSQNGEKLLYRKGSAWSVAALAQPVRPGEGTLATSDIQVAIDPRAEWREMYREAFRMQRAFFYDPGYHGLDLDATEKFYERYLDRLGSRADLDYLFQEAFGNLTVGHLYTNLPPSAPSGTPRNGLLGADYAAADGRWRFARVYAGESWNPQLNAPLTQPGVNVQAGEYLLAVNGRELTANDNVHRALEGTAGKQVLLRVGPRADGNGARDVTVVPIASDAMLRHLAWIDRNRRTVDSLSGGQLAYIYVPNTTNEGYTRFNRYFFAQQDRLGAVVDERYNGGGHFADYMIDYLRRDAPTNYMTQRYGEDLPVPAGAIYGPKVMLINEYAGSGGDELPWLFRRFRVGPLVGTRTWGGLVGIGGYPALMDGGRVTAPRAAFWSAEGEYDIENRGVAPDVEVELDPASWRAGRDPQLERAVSILMEQLAKSPRTAPKRPAFPTWAKGHTPGGTQR